MSSGLCGMRQRSYFLLARQITSASTLLMPSNSSALLSKCYSIENSERVGDWLMCHFCPTIKTIWKSLFDFVSHQRVALWKAQKMSIIVEICTKIGAIRTNGHRLGSARSAQRPLNHFFSHSNLNRKQHKNKLISNSVKLNMYLRTIISLKWMRSIAKQIEHVPTVHLLLGQNLRSFSQLIRIIYATYNSKYV